MAKKWWQAEDKDVEDVVSWFTSLPGMIIISVLVVGIVIAFIWELFR